MERVTLALDIGGSAVKAGLFESESVVKRGEWRHEYRDCGLTDAKKNLLIAIKNFYDGDVDAIGLSLAGLIATDDSLFRSTVITSFENFNLGQFLKDNLNVQVVNTDNDSDCGAVGEFYFTGHELFYVVAGSGIGSACVDQNGELIYLVRVSKDRQFKETMNHPLSDIGLRLVVNQEEAQTVFKDEDIELSHQATVRKLSDLNGDIQLGKLGSASGVGNILEIQWGSEYKTDKVRDYYQGFLEPNGGNNEIEDLYNNRYAAKMIASFARKGEPKSVLAFRLMGKFLGLAISKAEMIIHGDWDRFFPVHLSGQIMSSYDLFLNEVKAEMNRNKITCQCILSDAFQRGENPNLWGAYLRVKNKEHYQ